ncbi:hypothetical protein OPV22_020860 [Ensete ventricosum]|uniref:Uncharacterized protein n=1 Tax=Ensete ventricosum TaxID=4639 RepID=A0AAV8QQY7_ENSVE|nr:hypothetical protein OPV22_020860 [Ensete ventricosum]
MVLLCVTHRPQWIVTNARRRHGDDKVANLGIPSGGERMILLSNHQRSESQALRLQDIWSSKGYISPVVGSNQSMILNQPLFASHSAISIR